MSKSASEFTGTGGAESIAYSEATLKFKSVKDIPDVAKVRKHDRVDCHVLGNCIGYEYGVDKYGNDVMVRVIELDTVNDIKVIGRMPEKLQPVPPADPNQSSVDDALEKGGDDGKAGANDPGNA